MFIRKAHVSVAVAVVIVGLCSSCYSYALYPWFDETVSVFDSALLGKWGDKDEGRYVITRGHHDTYDIVYVEEDSEPLPMHGRLGKIDGVYYLDVMWKHGRDTPDIPEWLFGVHMLAKVELERDRARYTFIDIEKLDRLGSTGLRVVEVGDKSGYDEEDGLLITSSTRKLQQFLEEHGKTADIWANYPEDDPGWLPRQ